MSNGNALFEPCIMEVSSLADDLRVEMSASVYETLEATSPTSIARSDQSWYVRVYWNLTGKLARHFCGTWCLCLLLESVGPGREYGADDEGFCVDIKMDPCRDEPYYYDFKIDPNRIEARRCGSLYLVGVTIVALDPCGDPGHIAGYCKGPSIMVYPGEPHDEPEVTVE